MKLNLGGVMLCGVVVISIQFSAPAVAQCSASDCLIGQTGDVDLDGDVDAIDACDTCVTGPGKLGSNQYPCSLADFDQDTDFDLQDLAAFQQIATGSCDCPPNTQLPVPRIAQSTFIGEAPLTVTFDSSESTDAETVLPFHFWVIGEFGPAYTGEHITHTFQLPGEYTVTLMVVDAGLLANSTTRTITVSDGSWSLDDPVTENEARRFLWQAAFGPTRADIDFVVNYGYEAWLENQRFLPASTIEWADQQANSDKGYGGENPAHIWSDLCVEAPDQLRQRMAWALIQIIVNNRLQNTVNNDGNGLYYSTYIQHALGNYRNLLSDVTYSRAMGNYLTYRNNMKANPVLGTEPDENYAREVLQLFTCGLWQLNIDGSRIQDPNTGVDLATYDNEDIKQFARVFTGLRNGPAPINLNPMSMRVSDHDFEPKQLLDYIQTPEHDGLSPAMPATEAGAYEDIETALDNAFFHPSTAPHIASELIQRFTSSNPSPQYIADVAAAFEGGGPYGTGSTGNLYVTVKTILLHPEARDPTYRTNPLYGKRMEPAVAEWGLYRTLEVVDRPNEVFPFRIAGGVNQFTTNFGQGFMESPSVFNFYEPEYTVPNTDLEDAGLVAPELKIHNAITSIGLPNRLRSDVINKSGEAEPGRYSDYRQLAFHPPTLVNLLDAELMYGSLSSSAKSIIIDALDQITGDQDRVRTAVWLMTTSPEFMILK